MAKINILIILLFIVTFSFVSAAVPVQLNVNQDTGLTIFYPKFDYIPVNSSLNLHLHVSNISNGLPVNNTNSDCYFHLYDINGNHSFQSEIIEKDINGWDHELLLLSGNFSVAGTHAFYIWCNATNIGGSAHGTFIVSVGGLEITEGRAILVIGLIFLIFITSCFFLYLSSQMGEVGFKIFFLLTSLIFLLTSFITSYLIFMEGNIMDSINTITLSLITVIGMILFIIFIYMLIRQTVNALDLFKINKGLKMSPDYNVGVGRKVAGYDTRRAY